MSPATSRCADNRHAQAYFGVFKKNLPEVFAVGDSQEQDKWIKLAFVVDTDVDRAVIENSISPQNIEAEIRKTLMPKLFMECKSIGSGMVQAKKMVEMIIQITRVGMSGD
ncbi:hypothetical protein MO867_13130 [Microbulbifer sp. OS29]|uniref:Uncharacterized protein n=1 Tax=Microbulbifer okhotskensis TaxID=2926617 RepID=A0A9X2EP83_9GAMM|nr:hypothetical protein [Microbulbifer okhotskensis]MCO1335274.1 hypothetical protein [Microbulbifer okhotskensis]